MLQLCAVSITSGTCLEQLGGLLCMLQGASTVPQLCSSLSLLLLCWMGMVFDNAPRQLLCRLQINVTAPACSWNQETAAARQEITRTHKALKDIQSNISKVQSSVAAENAAFKAAAEAAQLEQQLEQQVQELMSGLQRRQRQLGQQLQEQQEEEQQLEVRPVRLSAVSCVLCDMQPNRTPHGALLCSCCPKAC